MFKSKILLVLTSLFLSTQILCAQTREEARIQINKDFSSVQKSLPINAGGFSITKMGIEGDDFVTCFEVDDQKYDYKSIAQRFDDKKQLFHYSTSNIPNLADLFIKSGLNMKLVITAIHSKDSKTIFISNQQMKEFSVEQMNTKDLIVYRINEQRKSLPKDMGHGIVFIDMYVEGDFLNYKYTTDGSEITIDDLKNKDKDKFIEENVINPTNETNDISIKTLMKCLQETNMGIKYTFSDNNNKESIVFIVSPSELKNKIHIK